MKGARMKAFARWVRLGLEHGMQYVPLVLFFTAIGGDARLPWGPRAVFCLLGSWSLFRYGEAREKAGRRRSAESAAHGMSLILSNLGVPPARIAVAVAEAMVRSVDGVACGCPSCRERAEKEAN